MRGVSVEMLPGEEAAALQERLQGDVATVTAAATDDDEGSDRLLLLDKESTAFHVSQGDVVERAATVKATSAAGARHRLLLSAAACALCLALAVGAAVVYFSYGVTSSSFELVFTGSSAVEAQDAQCISGLPRGGGRLPSNLSLLVVNGHEGVSNELLYALRCVAFHAGVSSLRVSVQSGIGQHVVRGWQAEVFYAFHRRQCESAQYDLLLVGDTIALSRPYLQHLGSEQCGRKPLLLYVSNRYDFALHADAAFQSAVAAAVRAPNVRVVQNNLAEDWYARRFRGVDLRVAAYIPATGGASPLYHQAAAQAEADPSWPRLPPADDSEVFVLDKAYARSALIAPLAALGIRLPVIPARFGGPLRLANRLVAHVPYQVNTMTLFEALAVNVSFLLPSLPLYLSWLQQRLVGIGDKTDREQLSAEDVSLQDMQRVVDWYRPELQHLFFYFDSLQQLQAGSAFRQRVAAEAAGHRQRLQAFMRQQTRNSTLQWLRLLEDALGSS